MFEDTICAISTALAKGAIAIVRMSGKDALPIIKKLAHLRKDLEPNTIIYGHIYDNDERLDEVLISYFAAFKSYTAEDMVEINCHGGIYVTRKILGLLLANGARLAEPGEFTRRAYLNGRINLAGAEAVNDMINAKNRFQAKSAMRGIDGSIERLLQPLFTEIKNVLAMIEVNIDYPEYTDEVEMTDTEIMPYLTAWEKRFMTMIDEAERFMTIRNGLKTVIVGKPNVGKSSLLNALIAEDKAIVTDIAGTTRDLVEGEVQLKNITLNLIDTAGIHESDDKIEQIGIAKSKKAIDEADFLIVLLDGSKDLDKEDAEILAVAKNKRHLVVYNKKDIKAHEGINIAAAKGDIEDLKEAIDKLFAEDVDLLDADVLNNERQIALMKQALGVIKETKNNIYDYPLDVTYNGIMEAYSLLAEILGLEYKEDLIDHMFKNFCLGK